VKLQGFFSGAISPNLVPVPPEKRINLPLEIPDHGHALAAALQVGKKRLPEWHPAKPFAWFRLLAIHGSSGLSTGRMSGSVAE